MTVDRRDVLRSFGVASAATLAWALGCGSQPPPVRRSPQVSRDVRSWLHDAVSRLSATYPTVHALAVSRRHTAVALDVVGPGLARMRGDGAVLTVRRPDSPIREHVTTELTAAGIDAAVRALGGSTTRRAIEFGPPSSPPDEPPPFDDRDLRRRVERLLAADAGLSSRIVYAAGLIDIDDTIVWSVAPGADREQRLVRIRESVTRAAWNGSRPVVASAEHAWSGGLDGHPLAPADIRAASEAALKLMTPGSFRDDTRTVLLDPSVAALLFDAAVHGQLTAATGTTGAGVTAPVAADAAAAAAAAAAAGAAASWQPDPARRIPVGGQLASPLVTLVDDPTASGAYGGFAFDDRGAAAAPLTLLDAGRVAGQLADSAGRARRPGHLAPVEAASSHLQLVPGPDDATALYSDGLVLEAGLAVSYDPVTDRIRIACARARELRGGSATGRIYADVELVGSLAELLTAVDAVARAPVSFALGGPPGAITTTTTTTAAAAAPAPLWRSIATPAVRTRGFVRARRGSARSAG